LRVAYARELVAGGHRPAVVARILRISRQAPYRVPRPRKPPETARRPPVDDVERAIVAVAQENSTDGYRLVTAWVCRRLDRAVNRKRVLRVMRERKLIQRRTHEPKRRRPGFFMVERPGQLWHLDMTSIWVAEHGWVYLNAVIDCCTREIVGWELSLRCRAVEAIAVIEAAVREQDILPGDAHARHRQRLRVHREGDTARHVCPRLDPSSRRLPRPRKPGVHRIVVPLPQRTLRLAPRVRDARPGPGGDRRLHLVLPADLGDRPVTAQAGQHDLELLRDCPRAVRLLLAQRHSPSIERPIVQGAPDAISASPLRGSAPIATGQPSHRNCQHATGERTNRRLHRPLPPPAPQPARLPHTVRSPPDLGRRTRSTTKHGGLNRQHPQGALHITFKVTSRRVDCWP
jgi:hypothetical protein